MKGIVVANATPLIAFSRIGRLDLLRQVVGAIIIPEEVYREISEYGEEKILGRSIRELDWIEIVRVRAPQQVDMLLASLDRGEAEVIVLATELKATCVIIDELAARKVAEMMELSLVGTVGILIQAKNKGLIQAVSPLLDDMIAKGIWYSREFYNAVLARLGERGAGNI